MKISLKLLRGPPDTRIMETIETILKTLDVSSDEYLIMRAARRHAWEIIIMDRFHKGRTIGEREAIGGKDGYD